MLHLSKTLSPSPAVRNTWVSHTYRHRYKDQQTAERGSGLERDFI